MRAILLFSQLFQGYLRLLEKCLRQGFVLRNEKTGISIDAVFLPCGLSPLKEFKFNTLGLQHQTETHLHGPTYHILPPLLHEIIHKLVAFSSGQLFEDLFLYQFSL